MWLAAGHRNSVIKQDFIGNIDFGGDCLADRHQTRMIIGTVADIREDMLFFSERRDADPRHAFRAHVGKGCGVPFHPLCHKVAADAGERAATIRDFRRTVVWATGAKIRRPLECLVVAAEHILAGLQKLDPVVNLAAGMKLAEPLRDNPCDLRRRQLADGRQDPFATLVVLADHARSLVGDPIVKLLFQLVLNDGAFFFNNQDLVEPFAELAKTVAFERPGHADLIYR